MVLLLHPFLIMIGVRMEFGPAHLVIAAALMADLVDAQASSGGSFSDNPYNFAQFNPPIASILIALVAALFVMGVCSVYLRRCSDAPVSVGSIRRGLSMRTRRGVAARGLDQEIIVNFPTFSYAEVKEHKVGKGALECAVCLNEFVEDDTLRWLPHCDHVFHPECIGAWLAHHTTCPVCRADLTHPAQSPPLEPPGSNRVGSRNGEIVVQIDDSETIAAPRNPIPNSETLNSSPNFKSHSTGHSLVPVGETLDRFTLRLPEGVKKEVMERSKLNRARSYAGGSAPAFRSGGEEDASRGSARSNQTLSERWVTIRRALSMKSPKVVSDGGSRSTSRMASLKCLEPKPAESPNGGGTNANLHV